MNDPKVGNIVKWGLVGVLAIILLPVIINMIKVLVTLMSGLKGLTGGIAEGIGNIKDFFSNDKEFKLIKEMNEAAGKTDPFDPNFWKSTRIATYSKDTLDKIFKPLIDYVSNEENATDSRGADYIRFIKEKFRTKADLSYFTYLIKERGADLKMLMDFVLIPKYGVSKEEFIEFFTWCYNLPNE